MEEPTVERRALDTADVGVVGNRNRLQGTRSYDERCAVENAFGSWALNAFVTRAAPFDDSDISFAVTMFANPSVPMAAVSISCRSTRRAPVA
jgi:hypothetical protein